MILKTFGCSNTKGAELKNRSISAWPVLLGKKLNMLVKNYGSAGASNDHIIKDSIETMVARVQAYVPGYRLKQEVQFERFGSNNPCRIPGYGEFEGLKASIFLEVEGAGHYLPTYAGNLDIMTSAALGTGEELVRLNK